MPIDSGVPELIGKDMCAPEDCGDGRLLFVRLSSPECPDCPSIMLLEADGRAREVLRRSAGDTILFPHCAATGTHVVYAVRQPGRIYLSTDIWIARVDGGTPRKLSSNAWPYASFHPDGRSVLVSLRHSEHFSLWEIPLDDKPPSQITFGEENALGADVSADGRTVAFVDSRDESVALLARLPDGTRRMLTSRIEDEVSQPHVTLDGKQVIAISTKANVGAGLTQRSIVAVATDNGDEVLLHAFADPAVLGVSPSGDEVIYTVRGSPTKIFAMPRTGGKPRLVTDAPLPVVSIAVGPDATLHLSLKSETGVLEAWRVPTAGGAIERDAAAPWEQIVPAPTGDWRAVFRTAGGRREAHILSPAMALDDPAARVIHPVGDVAWDHDGRSLVYTEGRAMHRLRVGTGEDVVLFEVDERLRGSPAVSPDGNTIYFTELVAHRILLITNFGDRPRPR